MAAAPPLFRFSLSAPSVRRTMAEFRRKVGPEIAERITRRAAFTVVGEATKHITTSPARVDTGRYRASWLVGFRGVNGGRDPLSGRFLPPGGGASQAGDGEVQERGAGSLAYELRVQSNVDYGSALEFGTREIPPGRHVARALEFAEADAQDMIDAAAAQASQAAR